MINKLVILFICLFFYASPSFSAVVSACIEGEGLSSLDQNAQMFSAPPYRYNNFWSRCDAASSWCSFFDDPDVQDLWGPFGDSTWTIDRAGSLINAEISSSRGFIETTLYAFPPTSSNNDTGVVRYEITTSTDLINNPTPDPAPIVCPVGVTCPSTPESFFGDEYMLGYALTYSFRQVVTPDTIGTKDYTISASLDESDIPPDHNAYLETAIYIRFYASWLGVDGRPVEYSEVIKDEVIRGDLNTSFSLPEYLFDVSPELEGTYAFFRVRVQTRLTLMATPPGDVDHDGTVDITDSILTLQTMSGISPTPPIFLDADVNGDGRIGIEETIFSLR